MSKIKSKRACPKECREFFAFQIINIPVKVLNASKRSFIAEHLVNNSTCVNSYNLNRFKTIKTCSNVFDLIKLEAICMLLRK